MTMIKGSPAVMKSSGSLARKQPVGSSGRAQLLLCNAFRLELDQRVMPLCSYSVSLVRLTQNNVCMKELKEVIESMWEKIKDALKREFVFVGQILFTTARLKDFTLTDGGNALDIRFLATHSPQSCEGDLAAQRVYSYVMWKACNQLLYEKVGRRYYANAEVLDRNTSWLAILKDFSQQLIWLTNDKGPHCVIDVTYKPLYKKTILEVLMQSLLDGDVFNFTDPIVQDEWHRRCNEATVCTLYNNKLYKIKAVHFSMDPNTQFAMKRYDSHTRQRKTQVSTYAEYYSLFYHKRLTEMRQPLLEAYSQKSGETVFLIPELCALTGFTEELRKNRTLLTEAMKHGKVSAQERYNSVMKMGGVINTNIQKGGTDWGVSGISASPLEIPARVLDKVEVEFGHQKRYSVEDGQFQKWLRNGLQNPVVLSNWIFIFPETDTTVLSIWLQSLRDIGDVAFRIDIAEPKRVTVTDQKKDLAAILEQYVTPETQLVLLLTPQADSTRVYQTLKTYTCTQYPVATQVVRSETIRKRQSIAAVLSRIVLQINAKLCGPLWHINLKGSNGEIAQNVYFDHATMVIGIDLYHHNDEFWLGCVASMDPHCAEFLSLPYFLERRDLVAQKCSALQEFLHEALMKFLDKNGCLPHRIVVYRGSTSVSSIDHDEIRQTEVESIKHVISSFVKGYTAELTFVVCAQRGSLRFFYPVPNETNIFNPESGTVVDTTVTLPGVTNFYLINHACVKGTSSPTHYFVLLDETSANGQQGALDALQILTYRLSYMYFNFAGSTKFPAPLMYAAKLASFSAVVVKGRQTHHPRLKTSLYYI